MRTIPITLLVLVLAATAVVASDESDFEVSAETRAILKLDHQYMLMRQNVSGPEEGQLMLKQNTAYNFDTATQLFWHSVSAYCSNTASLKSWSCPSCKKFGAFHMTSVLENGFNQGYVGWFSQGLAGSPIPGSGIGAKEAFVVVSFRGSSNLAEWIQDLSFSKFGPFSSKYPKVQVHGGFWSAYQGLKSKMVSAIATALKESGARTIIFTGHSLGAAISELAALDVKLNVQPDKYIAVYTQGSPRVGDSNFAALYTSKISASFREIHYKDVVTHLPPMILGFNHGPTEVWFQEGMKTYKVCSGSNGEDKSCANSIAIPASVSDHTTYRGVSVGGFCNGKFDFPEELLAMQDQHPIINPEDLAEE